MPIDLAALEQLGAVRWLALAPNVYPVLSALHILGIALLVGPILLVDLRLVGLLGPRLDGALDLLADAAACGLALAVGTGAWLFAVQATDYAAKPIFLAKLVLVACAAGNALLLRWIARGRPLADRAATPAGRAAGLTSIGLWLSALLAGRWIAFA